MQQILLYSRYYLTHFKLWLINTPKLLTLSEQATLHPLTITSATKSGLFLWWFTRINLVLFSFKISWLVNDQDSIDFNSEFNSRIPFLICYIIRFNRHICIFENCQQTNGILSVLVLPANRWCIKKILMDPI